MLTERAKPGSLWVALLLILAAAGITTKIPAMTEHRYERVALISNGGDAMPFVQPEYMKADDPSQVSSGDAVAYVSGSQEKLLSCNPVRIGVLAKAKKPDKTMAGGAVEQTVHEPFSAKSGLRESPELSTEETGRLRCAMWVRKLGTEVRHLKDLQTTVDLLLDRDPMGVVLTLALWNTGQIPFTGKFKMINVLPEHLEFRATVGVAEWLGLRQGRQFDDPIRAGKARPRDVAQHDLVREAIAFQEHLHGKVLIFQAHAVRVAPGAAVAVEYTANVLFPR